MTTERTASHPAAAHKIRAAEETLGEQTPEVELADKTITIYVEKTLSLDMDLHLKKKSIGYKIVQCIL